MLEDEIRHAESEYNRALIVLQKGVVGKPGFGAEAKYRQAYQWLVRLGQRPQLKLKYRNVKSG
jgi:hypothetical protein